MGGGAGLAAAAAALARACGPGCTTGAEPNKLFDSDAIF